jgi:hypothetical protein
MQILTKRFFTKINSAKAKKASSYHLKHSIMMKRKLLFAAALLIVAWAVTSCESISGCKVCKVVTTDSSNGDVTESSDTEYCGAALIAIEAQAPTTTGTLTSKYKCR